MALCVCDYCGKAFSSLGASVCPECMKILDEAYAKTRKYIYQNSNGVNFTDIVENAGIPEKALSYLISQGKIMLGGKSGNRMKCRICGKEAEDGVLCSRCKAKLCSENVFSLSSQRKKPERDKPGSTILPLTKK